jgi:hypothetical protein
MYLEHFAASMNKIATARVLLAWIWNLGKISEAVM